MEKNEEEKQHLKREIERLVKKLEMSNKEMIEKDEKIRQLTTHMAEMDVKMQ